MMRTSVILVALTSAVLGGTLIASAQVSSGSPKAAQQNPAKKESTDKPVQTDQQPVQKDQQNATTNRRQEAPSPAGDEADGVHMRSAPDDR
jgi:hypothetical protein